MFITLTLKYIVGINWVIFSFQGRLWALHRQEMPIHGYGIYSRKNFNWRSKKNENAKNNCHSSWLLTFRSKIQSFWKETQKHERTSVTLLPVKFIVYFSNCFYNNFYYVLIFSDVELGDVVTVGECRPLSKTVKFNVLKVSKVAGSKKKFQKF